MKKIIKTICASLLMAIILFSCDNRKIYIEQGLPKPLLKFLNSGKEMNEDTLKYNSKTGKSSLVYTLKIDGDNEVKDLTFKITGGTGTVTIDGKVVSDVVKLKNGSYNFTFTPNTGSKILIEYTLKDQYGKMDNNTLKLYAFDNTEPVADFEVKKLGVNSPLEYTIDASKSFDTDVKWGGGIKSFKYTINEYTFDYSKSSFNWVFDNTGNYSISVTVFDNNGVSNTKNMIFTVQ